VLDLRRWRTFISGLAVMATVSSLVVAATLAEGRPASRSETNDGGAWLLNRSEKLVGHVNRSANEVTGVAGPIKGSDFVVDQSDGIIVVHDRDASTVRLVDDTTETLGSAIQVPDSTGVEVHAIAFGIVVFEPATGSIWRFTRAALASVTDVSEEVPGFQSDGAGPLAVGLDGTTVVYDSSSNSLAWIRSDGVVSFGSRLDDAARPTGLTLVGSLAVLTRDDGSVVVSSRSGNKTFHPSVEIAVLQQPSGALATVTGITARNSVVSMSLRTGEVTTIRSLDGGAPLRPIVHNGCTWTVTTSPSPKLQVCNNPAYPLGASGEELQLRLVNGWVWVNAVNSGAAWTVNDDFTVDLLTDWTTNLDGRGDQAQGGDSGGRDKFVQNANADRLDGDVAKLDNNQVNEPPIAVDDSTRTRVGRQAVVDVLANDQDPDGDPLVVEAVDRVNAPDGTGVVVLPDGSGVQVTPVPGDQSPISFSYRIDDGRGGRAEANVSIEVIPLDAASNLPPETTTDTATVRAGESVSLNVISNDRDPEGDMIVLTAVDDSSAGGAVSFTPDGGVLFRPDSTNSAGTIELTYTVIDDFGASAEGTIRVHVRPAGSNQPPLARNDIGRTVVGHPVLLDLLANDVDPDGDLMVARGLQAVAPSGVQADLSPDGRFLFTPDAPGTYRFVYLVSDGPETDEAQVRIDVEDPSENRPPVAVKDEVIVTVGQSQLVRALDNDADPDGDIVGIVDWNSSADLEITEIAGVGFQVTARPTTPSRSSFTYWISDGSADPVNAEIVVAVSPTPPTDRVPVAKPDEVGARAGNTTMIPVLRNDFDPDGGPLRIVGPVGDRALLPEGTVRIDPGGRVLLVSVTPDQRFGFSFGYDIEDSAGNRASAVVNVRIVPPSEPNRSPTARPDVARTIERTSVSIDVIGNDSDPDGDPIIVEAIGSQPAHGSATILDNGQIQYSPASGFTGTDRFAYVLVDGFSPPEGVDGGPARSIGEILVGVMPKQQINRPPSALDDNDFPAVEVGSAQINLQVLSNDSDPDGDPLTITEVTVASVGVVDVAEDGGHLTFAPPTSGESRQVSFAYSIADGRGGTDRGQVTLDLVARPPDPVPPVAVDDTVGPVRAGDPITFDPLANDTDSDGPTSALSVVPSLDGAFTIEPDGRITIVAPEMTSQIRYSIVDATGLESLPAAITVLVVVNQGPKVTPTTVSTPFETPVTIDLTAGVTDPDNDDLLYALGRNVAGGSVSVIGSPGPNSLTVEFSPDTLFEGAATFDFTVDDQHGHNVAAAITVEVQAPGNRPPVATDSQFQFVAGTPSPIDLTALVTDPDITRDPLSDVHTFSIGSAQLGVAGLSVDPNTGLVTVSSSVDRGGATDSFSYTVTDIGGLTSSANISLTFVDSSHPAPTALADVARTLQTVAVDIPVLDNDIDNSPAALVGAGLIVTAVGVSAGGITSVSPDGRIATFVPNPAFFGTATFTYTIQDGRRGGTDGTIQTDGTITVDVVGFPDAPQPPTIGAFGSQYCVITWATPPGNGAPILGYQLDFTASDGTSGSQQFLTDPATSYRWAGLKDFVDYSFVVTAVNEAGFGQPSTRSLSCTPDVRPEPPGTPTVTFGNGQLDLSWPAALTQGSPVINYEIEIGGGLSTTQQSLANITNWTWTGLTNGTSYQFRVRAQNSAASDNLGWSMWSQWSATEHPLTVPDPAAAPVATRGNGQIVLDWTEPYDGGDPISLYQIQQQGTSPWLDVTPVLGANSYTWTLLPNGTPVSFRVRSVNRDPLSAANSSTSISAWSAAVTPCSIPDAPAQPSVVRGDLRVTVLWTPPNNQGCVIGNYTITNNFGVSQTAAAGATSQAFTGLTNGTVYTFTVAANNEVGPGVASAASVSAVPAGLPTSPALISAAPNGVGSISLSWGSANRNGGTVSRYEISNNGGASWRSAGLALSYVWAGLANSTTYSFRARAVNEIGPGAGSNVIGARTWGPPGQVPTPSASAGNGTVSVSWSAAAANGTAVDQYQVDVSNAGGPNGVGRGAEGPPTVSPTESGSGPTMPSAGVRGARRPMRLRRCSREPSPCSGDLQPAISLGAQRRTATM